MTWPMWTTRTLPWVSRSRGPRADRTLTSYRAAVAPRIAHCTPALGESVQRAVEEAYAEHGWDPPRFIPAVAAEAGRRVR